MAQIQVFIDEKNGTSDKKYPINIRFYVNRERIFIPTKIKIGIRDFDKKIGRVKKTEKDYKDLNLIIEKILSRINDIQVKYRLKNKELTKKLFLNSFSRPDDFDSFFGFVSDYQKNHLKEIEFSTLCTHNVVLKKLEIYSPNLHFDEITPDFIKAYRFYLLKKLKNAESTVQKNMATFKKYVRLAMKAGYIDDNPFEDIPIKRNMIGKIVYLTEEELKILIEKYNSNELDENYQKVLQFFLFLCFTSLHIGDAKRLIIEQFSKTTFTYYRVKLQNSKPDPIVVPISEPAQKLLSQIIGTRKSGKVFEKMIADQKINEYLKKISRDCEIFKPISSKAGRHTFATYYLYKNRNDFTTLQKILGHSDIRETLIYAHVQDISKQEGIAMFNSFKI